MAYSSRFDYSPDDRSAFATAGKISAASPDDQNITHTSGGYYEEEQEEDFDDGYKFYVHACGRLETILVESLNLVDVKAAARVAFDLPKSQDLDFAVMDKGGRRIFDDAQLSTVVRKPGGSGTLYLHFSDNAFHGLERRIESISHTQLGYIADQLCAIRQEHCDLRAEVRNVRLGLEQEQGGRGTALETARGETESLREFTRSHLQEMDDKLAAMERAVFDVKGIVHNEALLREQATAEMNKAVADTNESICAQAKVAEHSDEKIRIDLEELRRVIQLEVADREDGEVRVEQGFHDLREALSSTVESVTTEGTSLRRLMLDVKQTLSTEQRERMAADGDLATSLKELRLDIGKVANNLSSKDASWSARCVELDASVGAERAARQQAFADLTQQLSMVVESIEEEQMLRASEDAEIVKTSESLRHSAEEVRRRIDEVEASMSDASREMDRRLDEEARNKRESDGKTSRTLATLQELIKDESDRILHDFSERLHACHEGLEIAKRGRVELSDRIALQRKQFEAEQHEVKMRLDRMHDELGLENQRLSNETQERQHAVADIGKTLQLIQDTQRADGQARESLESIVSEVNEICDQIAQRHDALQAFVSEGGAGLRPEHKQELKREITDPLQSGIDFLRDGLEKVQETVQNDKRSRSETTNKLRDDIRDGLQKEIDARKQLSEKLKEETASRHEFSEVIQQALEELRVGLETHSHEYDEDEEDAEDDEE